jgi:hypothetical protein
MHKGVILLTNATDREDAVSNVYSFMEGYKDQVYDWYVIGGRWSGTLNINTKLFFEKANEILNETYPNDKLVKEGLYTSQMMEENKATFQKIWEDMGEMTVNPHCRNQYSDTAYPDDVLPLSQCIDIVKEWTKDMNEKADEYWEKMVKERESEVGENKRSTMSAYYAGIYKNCKYDDFSDESNVFDTDSLTNNPEKALKNPDSYYAVMIDMHN